MGLIYLPGQVANTFEASVLRELGRLKVDGYVAHNILLPNVRDRFNPNEHDIVLLLPELAYTIDAKEYAAGEYRIAGNSSVEWRRYSPEYRREAGRWRLLRGLPNPFYVAFQKAKVLHGLLTRIDARFHAYRVESMIVVPDHAEVQPDAAAQSDPSSSIALNLRVVKLSQLVQVVSNAAAGAGGKRLTGGELSSVFQTLGALPAADNGNATICGFSDLREVERIERGCPVSMRAFKGVQEISDLAVEIRIYRKWPWNQQSDRFLRRLKRRLQSLHRAPISGVPRVLFADEFPDLVVYASAWYEGESLSSLVARRGALPIPLAAALLRHLAGTVGQLHEAGITQLDLRPEHVLIGSKLDQTSGKDHQINGLNGPVIGDGRISTAVYADDFDASFVAPELLEHRHPERRGPTCDLYSLARIGLFCALGDIEYRSRVERADWTFRTPDRRMLSALARTASPAVAARPNNAEDFIAELIA